MSASRSSSTTPSSVASSSTSWIYTPDELLALSQTPEETQRIKLELIMLWPDLLRSRTHLRSKSRSKSPARRSRSTQTNHHEPSRGRTLERSQSPRGSEKGRSSSRGLEHGTLPTEVSIARMEELALILEGIRQSRIKAVLPTPVSQTLHSSTRSYPPRPQPPSTKTRTAPASTQPRNPQRSIPTRRATRSAFNGRSRRGMVGREWESLDWRRDRAITSPPVGIF